MTITKTDYSQIADYDKVRPPPADIWITKIIQHGKINQHSLILDVGCGTGRFPLDISQLTKASICALEISIDMLKKAVEKNKTKTIQWIRGDAHKLPFRDNLFDCVYMTLVLHHIEHKQTALKEIYRTLKKDRNCIIMTPSHYRIRKHILRHFPGVVAIDLKRVPTIPKVKTMMTQTGFKNVHHHPVKYDEGPMPTQEYLDRVRKKYISTLTLLSQEQFEKGLKTFEQKIKQKYGNQITRTVGQNFVVGNK